MAETFVTESHVDFTYADILEEMSNNPEEFLDLVLRVDIILTMDDYFRERNISRRRSARSSSFPRSGSTSSWSSTSTCFRPRS